MRCRVLISGCLPWIEAGLSRQGRPKQRPRKILLPKEFVGHRALCMNRRSYPLPAAKEGPARGELGCGGTENWGVKAENRGSRSWGQEFGGAENSAFEAEKLKNLEWVGAARRAIPRERPPGQRRRRHPPRLLCIDAARVTRVVALKREQSFADGGQDYAGNRPNLPFA